MYNNIGDVLIAHKSGSGVSAISVTESSISDFYFLFHRSSLILRWFRCMRNRNPHM